MEFQKEEGRIFAVEGEKLLAEVIFPAQDGVAHIDRTFVDDSLPGPRASQVSWSGRRWIRSGPTA